MASARDRLRQANKENAANRGNTSTNDTVFGDFANRKEVEFEAYKTDIEHNIEPEETLNINPDNASLNTEPENNADSKVIEERKPIGLETDNIDDILTLQPKPRAKTITFSMTEDAFTFLRNQAAWEGMTTIAYFETILKNEMYSSEYKEDELMKECRKRQSNVVNKTFAFNEPFINQIKETARKYYMKPTNFARYCIEKEKLKIENKEINI